jgi:sugar-specific transcriptional regulator TrmB
MKDYSKEELIMSKKKTYTIKGHRQIQKEKEQVYKAAQEELAIITGNIKYKILNLFPELLAEQVQAALSAGLDVELNTKVSAKALMDIIRS